MFLRFVGQSVGAAGCGAVLNMTMLALDPAAVGRADRLLDQAARAAMPAVELEHLTDVLASSLHNAYLFAAALSLATLVIAWQLPAGLSPRRH
jgi:hypothetical protein